MESIYHPSGFPCSEKLNLKKYFNNYKSDILETELLPTKSKNKIIAQIIGTDVNCIAELQAKCDIEKLTCTREQVTETPPDTIRHLLTLPNPCRVTDATKQQLLTVKTKSAYNENTEIGLKYKDHVRRNFETIIMKRDDFSNRNDLEFYHKTIFFVRVYYPFYHKYMKKNYSGNCKYSHEIGILGSQTLADLRDKILCNTDIGICREVEVPTPNLEIDSVKAKELYPSGFFFINDIFYNDFRHEKAFDYSEVILKWATDNKIGPLHTSEMEKTKIEDLNLRLGYPYVYQHQGDCEHIIVFSDARLLQKNDSISSDDYPFYQSVNRFVSQICMICGSCTARWICALSDRLPHDNTYLCHRCFMSYCYIDNKKVGDFGAYPYFDRSTIM